MNALASTRRVQSRSARSLQMLLVSRGVGRKSRAKLRNEMWLVCIKQIVIPSHA